MSENWAFRNNAMEAWQHSSEEPEICYEKRLILPCPFCEGEPAPLDENDHTSCTNITCGSTAYMHVDAWNNRPAIGAYDRIKELEAELGGWCPIDTAPKDGTRIDVWAKFEKSGWRRQPDAYWNEKIGNWQLGQYNAEDYMVTPIVTHWMPLPSAPL